MTNLATTEAADCQRRRVSIGFINFAHALDHYAALILATAVIELAVVYDWSYAQLIALGTPSFIAVVVFSLPAGWLADRWTRRHMMALSYLCCGGALAARALAPWLAATVVGLFVLIALSAGLVFNIVTVALPKIVDERLGLDLSLVMVGGMATLIFMCGAIAQFTMGRLVEKFPLHLLFAAVAVAQFVGVAWAAYARGPMLIVALA